MRFYSPRDFYYPVAAFSSSLSDTFDTETNQNQDQPLDEHIIFNKMNNTLFHRPLPSSYTPYNVVAWHGNYAPYKYNLLNFCTINSVSYDHPDPSIYTVLTVQDGGHGDDSKGEALADFIVFPPRWSAAEHTFRPPYFHRNCMSEFMGLIYGQYDGKQAGDLSQTKSSAGETNSQKKRKVEKKGGFRPGGCSLHPVMCPHGPDQGTFAKASKADSSKPVKLEQGLAFMFETKMLIKVSNYARTCAHREIDYVNCWDGLDNNFEKKRIRI